MNGNREEILKGLSEIISECTIGQDIALSEETDIFVDLNGNYQYVKIEIHEAKCQGENLLTKTALHESGHALGLSHVTCGKSAMCPYMDSPNMLANPSDADRAALRHVYNAYK